VLLHREEHTAAIVEEQRPMSTMNDLTPDHRDRSAARADRGHVMAGALTALRRLSAAALVVGLGLSVGCAAQPTCRKGGVKGAVVTGARTTGEAVETGAKTAAEGVKTAGKTVGGMVTGGTDEAREEWNEGKAETKATAREGAADVDEEANLPLCEE